MVNLVSVLRSQAIEQDRTIALKDAFHTWDGALSEDVILQGIHSRLQAVAKDSGGLQLHRDLLSRVKVRDVDGTTPLLFSVYSTKHLDGAAGTHWFPYGDQWMLVTGFRVDHFHPAELERAGKWLMDNFHH